MRGNGAILAKKKAVSLLSSARASFGFVSAGRRWGGNRVRVPVLRVACVIRTGAHRNIGPTPYPPSLPFSL